MKKSILAGSIVLFLGQVSSASAITVEVTSMGFGINQLATGTLTSIDNGPGYYQHGEFTSNYGSVSSTFFGAPYSGPAFEYFDSVGVEMHFSGDSPEGPYDYAFTLSEGQIAWGLAMVWSVGGWHPVLNIMDCGAGNVGDICTGIGTPMQLGEFPGEAPTFNGVVVSAVPIPATIWLLISGLLGLSGFRKIMNSKRLLKWK